MKRLLAAVLLCLPAFAAHAQLSIEITGAGATRIPIAIAPFAGEGALAQRASPPSCAPTWSAAGCSARSKCRRSTRRSPRPRRSTTRSGNRAWRMRWCSARSRRGPTAGSRCASSCSTPSRARTCRGSPTRCRASRRARRRTASPISSTRSSPARKACSPRASPTWSSAAPKFELQIADADGAGEETALVSLRADHFPGLVARRPAPRLRILREQEAGGLRAFPAGRQAPRGGQLQGLELGAGLVAGRLAARGVPVARRRLADLPGEPGRQQRAPHLAIGRHRHGTSVLARRSEPIFHFGPRRQPADLPDAGERRRGAEGDFRGELQRFAAHQPGRQGARLHRAQRRQVPGRHAGSRDAADADPDRQRQGRIPQLRSQRPHDSAGDRDRRPRRAFRGVGRRARQAAPDAFRRATCGSRPGGHSFDELEASNAYSVDRVVQRGARGGSGGVLRRTRQRAAGGERGGPHGDGEAGLGIDRAGRQGGRDGQGHRRRRTRP